MEHDVECYATWKLKIASWWGCALHFLVKLTSVLLVHAPFYSYLCRQIERTPMIYPNNFEHKIGFSEVRTLLKGRCMSTLGTEWVDNQVKFSNKFELVKESLEQAREFALIRMTEE